MTLDDVVAMLLAEAMLDACDAGRASAYCGLCASVEGVRLAERALRAGWVYR